MSVERLSNRKLLIIYSPIVSEGALSEQALTFAARRRALTHDRGTSVLPAIPRGLALITLLATIADNLLNPFHLSAQRRPASAT